MEKYDEASQSIATPKFFTFILTNENYTWVYFSCLIFKENPWDPELKESLLGFNIDDPCTISVPKAIVIVSHYCFGGNYREFLKSLYSIHLAKTNIPLERYISNFVDEIPWPDNGSI